MVLRFNWPEHLINCTFAKLSCLIFYLIIRNLIYSTVLFATNLAITIENWFVATYEFSRICLIQPNYYLRRRCFCKFCEISQLANKHIVCCFSRCIRINVSIISKNLSCMLLYYLKGLNFRFNRCLCILMQRNCNIVIFIKSTTPASKMKHLLTLYLNVSFE